MCELYVITIITKDMTEIKQQNNPVKKYYKESERASDRERERGGGRERESRGHTFENQPSNPIPFKKGSMVWADVNRKKIVNCLLLSSFQHPENNTSCLALHIKLLKTRCAIAFLNTIPG